MRFVSNGYVGGFEGGGGGSKFTSDESVSTAILFSQLHQHQFTLLETNDLCVDNHFIYHNFSSATE